MVIRPYKKASKSARELAKKLDVKLLYFPRRGQVLNWGSPEPMESPSGQAIEVVNAPEAVARASSKLSTFQLWGHGDNIVPWTTDIKTAQQWSNEDSTVLGRQMLRGHSGHGIEIFEPGSKINVICPLYTKYIKKAKEFRVHVFKGEVIDVQEKRKKEGEDSSLVRSHENGYVYCRDRIEESTGLRELAIDAVQKLGLHFGAVDIIWNKKENKNYLLEVNTAPGIEGTTLDKYVAACKKHFKFLPLSPKRLPSQLVHVGLGKQKRGNKTTSRNRVQGLSAKRSSLHPKRNHV